MIYAFSLFLLLLAMHSSDAAPNSPPGPPTFPIPCNNPHEHYECGSACQTECATLGEPCLIANVRCNDACYCDSGYARDGYGTCVPISQCPKRNDELTNPIPCHNPHEHYECGSACQTECSTLNDPCMIASFRCVDACYCNQGYARNGYGTCIPVSQCPIRYY